MQPSQYELNLYKLKIKCFLDCLLKVGHFYSLFIILQKISV